MDDDIGDNNGVCMCVVFDRRDRWLERLFVGVCGFDVC